ncbi:helix-turn-helix domain-containing protein [Nisaea sp.]|uniref:helix-turn-helix domain-containing protein n=1 Tax=Nisaea sp. TaxID=2024842 RepID=UPI003264B1A1
MRGELFEIIQNSKIHKFLRHEPIQDPGKDQDVYLFYIRRIDNQIITKKDLQNLSVDLKKIGKTPVFLEINSDDKSLNDIASNIVRKFFNKYIKSYYLSRSKSIVNVWIVPKKTLFLVEKEEIENRFSGAIEMIGYKPKIQFVAEPYEISEFDVIGMLRKLAPCSFDQLISALSKIDSGVSKKPLSRILDRLRKRKLILRKENKEYALTLTGLKTLGTRKDGKSPDIIRMLELARSAP